MSLGNTRKRGFIQHGTHAGSIALRHFKNSDLELHFSMIAVLRDRCEKLVLGAASAASLTQNG